GVVHGRSHSIKLRLVHRETLPDGAEIEQGPAERPSRLRIRKRHLDRHLCGSNAHRDEDHAFILEIPHDLVEPTVDGAKHLVFSAPYVTQPELRGVGAPPSVLVELSGNGEALGAGWH